MKKLILTLLLVFLSITKVNAIEELVQVYSEDNKFGLIQNKVKITEPIFTKLIRLGDNGWICNYKKKYGIIDNKGNNIVTPKYSQANRYASKFAKLGSKGKYGLFDEYGNVIINQEYNNISILYGKMFLVEKNYKFGLISYDGNIIMAPTADDIYMPKPNVIKIKYEGIWYEIEQKDKDVIQLSDEIQSKEEIDKDFKITQIVQNPFASTGYGVISASDYLIKLISSISPSYEETIDELILNHGADTATILIKSSWLFKFPFVYMKNYINNVKAPNNGPLSDLKSNLKNKMKETK